MKNTRLLIFTILAVVFIVIIWLGVGESEETKEVITTAAETVTGTAIKAEATPLPETDPTEGIYTYLQGPKSWTEKRTWSGEWGKTYMDGGSFGGFGCGLCCMANIYSTFSPYECTPLSMYNYAQRNTDYWSGAIEWTYMKETMEKLGFSCMLEEKPETLEEFRTFVENSMACVMLVSSYNDDSYWQDTPGHYVTTFLYEKETDKIFLGDSGNPDHNRHFVSLKKMYKALKTASGYQFMTVTGYDDENNKWKKNAMKGKWVSPEWR